MLFSACAKQAPLKTRPTPQKTPTLVSATSTISLTTTKYISPTSTSTQIPTSFNIGVSTLNRPIDVERIGAGSRLLVLVAALHGDEPNTTVLLQAIDQHYRASPPPSSVTLYIIPIANPDSYLTNARLNANGVDLNRNWDTDDWQADTQGPSGKIIGGGGAAPFSELETLALADFLSSLQAGSIYPVTILFYHAYFSPDGSVIPSPNPTASALGQGYAIIINSYYAETWSAYAVTGEALTWCAENEFICLEIELPSREKLSPQAVLNHITALTALIDKLLR